MRSTKIAVGDAVPTRELSTIHDKPVTVPDPGHVVHLQFRRFAGCPICNVHLRSITQRHDEIVAAGIREVVVFHSTAEAMRPYQGELLFDTVADPTKRLYQEFGIRESISALGSLRAAGASLRGIPAAIRSGGLRGATGAGERHLGLPADFLIHPDGRVIAAKYGTHAYDQWSVDELLEIADVPTAT